MGDLVQQSVTQQDYSLTSGVLTISVFALFTTALSWTQWRFPRTRSLINGKPIVIIRDGLALSEALRQQRLSMADLLAAARQQGIRSVGDVDLAIFENDGRISFFTRNDDPEGAPETASAG